MEWTSGVSDWSHTQVSSRRTWFNLPCGKTVADALSNLKQFLCPNQSAVPCLVGVGKLGWRTAVPLTPRIWRALCKRGPAHLLAHSGENSLVFGANMNTQWWINTLLRTKVIEELLPGTGKDNWMNLRSISQCGRSFNAELIWYHDKRLNVYSHHVMCYCH